MQLRVVDRPAFLLHTLGTKARIAAHRLLVLLALAHVRCGARIDLGPGRGGRGSGEQQRDRRHHR